MARPHVVATLAFGWQLAGWQLAGCAPRAHDEPSRHAGPALSQDSPDDSNSKGPESDGGAMDALVDAGGVFFRDSGGGEIVCRRLALRPDLRPGGHAGAAILEQEGTTITFRYDGAPPRLSAPRAHAGDRSMALPCTADSTVGWYADAETCRDPLARPAVMASGCTEALEPPVRAKVSGALDGTMDEALLTVLTEHEKLWVGDCERPWLRATSRRSAAWRTWKPELATAPDALPLLHPTHGNPMIVVDDEDGVTLYELPLGNPNERRDDEAADIACCGRSRYAVLEVTSDRAVLVDRRGRVQRWHWSKRACRDSRRAARPKRRGEP